MTSPKTSRSPLRTSAKSMAAELSFVKYCDGGTEMLLSSILCGRVRRVGIEYWKLPPTSGAQIYGATVTCVWPSYCRSIRVGVDCGAGVACCATAGAYAAADAARATIVAAKKRVIESVSLRNSMQKKPEGRP